MLYPLSYEGMTAGSLPGRRGEPTTADRELWQKCQNLERRR